MSNATVKQVITQTLTEEEKEEAVQRLFRDFDRKDLEKLATSLYLNLLEKGKRMNNSRMSST